MLELTFNQTFIQNKYSKYYFNIITNACQEDRKKKPKSSKSFVYYESHHIIPKSIKSEFSNFTQHPWNKVLLTPKEHFICHLLLTKMLSGSEKNKMVYAMWAMTNQQSKYQQRFHSNLYARYKATASKALSSERKGKTLEELYGDETALIMREKFKQRKHRGPCSEQEKKDIGKRFSDSWKTKTAPRGFQVKQPGTKHCENCGKDVDFGNYARHHGENCKWITKTCPTCHNIFQTTLRENKKHCGDACYIRLGKVGK